MDVHTVLPVAVNIGGTICVLYGIFGGLQMFNEWLGKLNANVMREEASVALGIPVEEVDRREHESKVTQLLAARFSSELFRNRVSDLCWWIALAWETLGYLLTGGLLLGAIWETFTVDRANSADAWLAVAVLIFFVVSDGLFLWACKVVTGRYPGEARKWRKALV